MQLQSTLEFYLYNFIKLIKVLIYFGHRLLSLRFLIEDIMHRPLPIVQVHVNGFSWYRPTITIGDLTNINENHMATSNSNPTMRNEPRPTLLPLFPEQALSLSIQTREAEHGDTYGFQIQESVQSTPMNTNEDELDLELRLGLGLG